MTFVTRARARVDRMACPWLIRRFIDPGARILFVPADRVVAVAKAENGLPFDVPDVGLGHHADRFADDDAMLAAETPMYDALYEYCRSRLAA
ncbi:MAG: chromate resistance protein [Candidatus Eremiobacteraeota bacterium]|nr:chromate resistance protein [Candidatus Eremiobacteraeota bacterium]